LLTFPLWAALTSPPLNITSRHYFKKKIDIPSTVIIQSEVAPELLKCKSGVDANLDEVVDRYELGDFINMWANGKISRDKLGLAINDWAIGC